jgi:hypothetical protein
MPEREWWNEKWFFQLVMGLLAVAAVLLTWFSNWWTHA